MNLSLQIIYKRFLIMKRYQCVEITWLIISTLRVTSHSGWMVLEECRTSYLSGPMESEGSSQCTMSSASMVWICDRLNGGLGFTVEKKKDAQSHRKIPLILQPLSYWFNINLQCKICCWRENWLPLFLWANLC